MYKLENRLWYNAKREPIVDEWKSDDSLELYMNSQMAVLYENVILNSIPMCICGLDNGSLYHDFGYTEILTT